MIEGYNPIFNKKNRLVNNFKEEVTDREYNQIKKELDQIDKDLGIYIAKILIYNGVEVDSYTPTRDIVSEYIPSNPRDWAELVNFWINRETKTYAIKYLANYIEDQKRKM